MKIKYQKSNKLKVVIQDTWKSVSEIKQVETCNPRYMKMRKLTRLISFKAYILISNCLYLIIAVLILFLIIALSHFWFNFVLIHFGHTPSTQVQLNFQQNNYSLNHLLLRLISTLLKLEISTLLKTITNSCFQALEGLKFQALEGLKSNAKANDSN